MVHCIWCNRNDSRGHHMFANPPILQTMGLNPLNEMSIGWKDLIVGGLFALPFIICILVGIISLLQ